MKTNYSILLILVITLVLFGCGKSAKEYIRDGDASSDINDYKGAIYSYNKAIEINPNYAPAYINRAAAKHKLKDFQGAIADLNKAIELFPELPVGYYCRGLTKFNLGQRESACLDLSKAGELGYKEAYETIKDSCK